MSSDSEDVIATLARIRRALTALESECGRSVELRERFAELLDQVETARRSLVTMDTPQPKRNSRKE